MSAARPPEGAPPPPLAEGEGGYAKRASLGEGPRVIAALNHTHDPAARSWVPSANQAGSDFPLQNLPLGIFRPAGSDERLRGGIAIGDQVLDLAALAATGHVQGQLLAAVRAASAPSLNDLFALGQEAWRTLRHGVFALLREDAGERTRAAVRACLVPQAGIEHSLPVRLHEFTDFYTSLDHARNAIRLVLPDAEVAPNFHWLPMAYHGRASSVGVSGHAFHRPNGQVLPAGATQPLFGPCAKLDYEMELALWIGSGNAQGRPVPVGQAEEHIFGVGLLNDWSARDLQMWEMAPLGPFQSKNFATTVSPWIVTMEALAPFRVPLHRPADAPQPLAYLRDGRNASAGGIDIRVEVWLDTAQSQREGTGATRLSHSSFRHQYWTPAQMVAHHTAGGCPLRPGDLLGTGTISGPEPDEAGALLELTRGGASPVTLRTGEQRGFLQDGDTVRMTAWCERPGAARIGFGTNCGTVLPALSLPA